MSGRQGFENERKWLHGLVNKSEGATLRLFALVGFERGEAEYLVELAKERFKTIGLELPIQAEVMNEAALEKLRCFQYSLFEKAPMALYEMKDLTAKEQRSWVDAFSHAGVGVLLVVSGKLDASWKSILNSSCVLDVSDEKPWHRQDRLAEWFRAFLKHRGLEISPSLANEVVQAYSMDRRALKTQAISWSDEKGYKGAVHAQDLQMDPSYTIWKLLDDLWQAKTSQALTKLISLLKEEASGISLSALLRQQWSSLGTYFENNHASTSHQKKNHEMVSMRLGKEKWKIGLRKIHQTQLDLRSSKPAQATLERLLIELTQLQR